MLASWLWWWRAVCVWLLLRPWGGGVGGGSWLLLELRRHRLCVCGTAVPRLLACVGRATQTLWGGWWWC